jgi:RNA polymerase sigma factor (sigma-70 family)
MRIPSEIDPDVATVIAAQRGDRRAVDVLAAAYLPLVYNIVGRAMNGHPDVDDVVQETMLRAVRGIGELRDPAAFRSWLVAIAIRQVRDSYRDRLAQPPTVESDAPSPDFADATIERLGLSGQRLETAEATRWLDDEDGHVLALWWQEAAGKLRRADLAVALDLSPAHAAVRVARMKERLVTSRTVVRALRRVPPCPSLAAMTSEWDREPSPLWRKRLARHVRECPWCQADTAEMIPAERLLSGMPLIAVPAALAGATLGLVSGGLVSGGPTAGGPAGPSSSGTGNGGQAGGGRSGGHGGGGRSGGGARGKSAGRRARLTRHARHTRLLKASGVVQPKLVAASVALVTCAAGGTIAVVHAHQPAAPVAMSVAAPRLPTPTLAPPVPLVTHTAQVKRPAPKRSTPPPATVTSERKGVATWDATGASQELAASGASWYYDWAATPSGITTPASASFVPMIWGSSDVTAATLDQVKSEGDVLLGFNEPDQSGQANMTVAQALSLWPQLEATGMTLGSPAVSSGAATPGGWLDQFMTGAKARGYRVNFITVHWYGGDFSTGPAVQQLESYLQAIYNQYHLPIWITEFALTSYAGPTPTFPTEEQQAAFLTAATEMLDGLPYVQRYAWFALPVSSGSGTTGLFNPGPAATEVGRAFEAAS